MEKLAAGVAQAVQQLGDLVEQPPVTVQPADQLAEGTQHLDQTRGTGFAVFLVVIAHSAAFREWGPARVSLPAGGKSNRTHIHGERAEICTEPARLLIFTAILAPQGSPDSMSKKKTRRTPPAAPSFDQARDELFSHILRCGVLEALPEHQKEWFDDTMQYIAERYEALGPEDLAQIRVLGERYCQPVVSHGVTASVGIDD
jgi:hypothetical protein